MRLHLAATAALAISGFSIPSFANAQDVDWAVECGEEVCSVMRALTRTDTGNRVATFMYLVAKSPEQDRIGVAIALGTAVKPGIRAIAGETTIDIPFEVCYPDGCRALDISTQDYTQALTENTELEIRYFPFSAERPVSLKMPLSGLGDTIAKTRAGLATK